MQETTGPRKPKNESLEMVTNSTKYIKKSGYTKNQVSYRKAGNPLDKKYQ